MKQIKVPDETWLGLKRLAEAQEKSIGHLVDDAIFGGVRHRRCRRRRR